MLFSHISDTHLGLAQYGLEERENDVYDSFNEAIDVSISDHVDFVVFAGDIFHVPNPSGTPIIQMANALRRLKENNIDSFFILGEHDISRIRSTPIPYVYHNLRFSSYIGQGQPLAYKGILLAGFDKIRKNEIPSFAEKFALVDKAVKEHTGHKILVMHQGIAEANPFAAELSSSDLPKNFTYYAMGHLHDRFEKRFSHLGGPLVYPGSIEMTTSEGIKEKEKGFYEVDISLREPDPNWVKLSTRPQLSAQAELENLTTTIDEILEKISPYTKKPIVELKISGNDIRAEIVQSQINRLAPHTLHCVWKPLQRDESDSSVLINRPASIDEELFRFATSYLGSEKLASFAIRELLPVLAANKFDESTRIVEENFEHFKRSRT
jgi:DNA repair exonuclease SbcCD nuclease subunit